MRSFGRQGDLYSDQLCKEQVFGKKMKAYIDKESAQTFHSIYSFHSKPRNYFY